MKIEDVLIPKNIGKKFKFNLNGQEMITEVKGYYTCGYQKIVLDFIDEVDFEEFEREIDWNRVPKWTKVQVRDNDKHGWANRYFIGVNNGLFKLSHPFIATIYDEFIHNGYDCENNCYQQCKIHSSVEIQEEWYKDYIEEDDFESLY